MSIRKHISIISETPDDGGRFDREAIVEEMIRKAVERTGLDLSDKNYPIMYSEYDDEIEIAIFESASIQQLQAFSVFGQVSVRSHPTYLDMLLIQIVNVPKDVHTMKMI